MNEVRLYATNPTRTYTFSDATRTLIQGAAATMYFSPLGDELRAGACKIPVVYTPRLYSMEADAFRQIKPGSQITLLQSGAAAQLFFLTAITGGKKLQGGRYLFVLEGTDLAGVLANVEHTGGIYENAAFSDVLIDAIGHDWLMPTQDATGTWRIYTRIGLPYIGVSEDVYDARVDGWLPYTTDFRSSLRGLLQQVGAYIRTGNLSGAIAPIITTDHGGTPLLIPDTEIHAGDEYVAEDAVTDMVVNEHSYYEGGADPEELYDASGAAVSGYRVVFDSPHYDLAFTGGSIIESGANYAVITGQGVLTGRPYSHNVRQLTASTGRSGTTVVKTIDNPLISPLNSAAMLQKAVDYYGSAKTIRHAIKAPDGLQPGDFLRLTDPLGELAQGYPVEVNLTFSQINKSDQLFVAGWTPAAGSVYTEEQIFDEDGTLTVPAGVIRMRLILIQGGKGGWGGYKGGDATQSSAFGPSDNAGEGGEPGEGGSAGKVYQIDIEAEDLAASYTITVGAPGSPGAADHGEGAEGTHSTATGGGNAYSSASGTVPGGGITDPMDGTAYALEGPAGVYAGKPGEGVNYGSSTLTDGATSQTGTTTTWRSGASRVVSGGVHGGGGPAYGSDGQNGGNTYSGSGADAALDGFNGYTAPVGSYGSGGIGGNGGGGGGGSTDASVSGGTGGHGSPGGPGAQGAVIALFAYGTTPAPIPTPNWLYSADSQQLYDYYYEPLAAAEED